MRNLNKNKALVLLSGGQDSTTCLAWAKKNFNEIHTISFFYGQRHKIELESANIINQLAKVTSHTEIDVKDLFAQTVNSGLLEENSKITDKYKYDNLLLASFVPFRNVFFLTIAAAKAYALDIQNLVTGICQTDYSGYPDCRNTTKTSLCTTLSLACDSSFEIHSPLMWLSKSETVMMMKDLGYLNWYKYTHTCYEGKRPACGICPACQLRIKGFKEAGIKDPLEYEEIDK